MKRLLVAGTGFPEIFSLVNEINSLRPNTLCIEGFIDDNFNNSKRDLAGYKFLGAFDVLKDYPDHFTVNTIARSSHQRYLSTCRLKRLGANFINLIHPSCSVSLRSIGIGNILSSGCCLEYGSSVGSHNLFLRNVIVGHDTSVADYCFFGHNSVINGHSEISSHCFIGASSVIGPSVKLGKYCVVSPNIFIPFDGDEDSLYLQKPPYKLSPIPNNSPHFRR